MTSTLQIVATHVAKFMSEHRLNKLTMSLDGIHYLLIEEDIPDHGADEKRIANGQ